ncbi:MAG: DUF262 domain-containing HNH endonuclease family protein [Flavobacterium sp.]|nr:DUF262 domain-containing HNH endonuclease family protein [Flavobacterium sp.]
MQFRPTTVLGLFDSSQKHFIIPVYQRAYSWDKEQWNIFLTDLKERIRGDNSYFYGNLLLETVKKDVQYEIIDGQQRLTTLTIFIRSLLDLLKKRGQSETFEIDFDSKEKIYFKNGGNIKLRPVEYDRACFESLIVEGNNKFATATPSQERIKNGRKFFATELEKLSTTDLLSILEKLETTELTCIELDGKKDSALMFELQNNRGKDLTNMEKIKSYFMYQMYVYSPEEETESNIEFVSNIFKLIYLIINDLKSLNEDSVLIYHCNAFIKGYPYRTLDDIKEVFVSSTDKVKWIKEFVKELHTSFSNIKKMENSDLPFLQDLRKLSIPAFAYPFIIKGYKYYNDKEDYLNTLYNILEIVVFRYRLINSRADFISRLNEILLGFNGDLDSLKTHFKNKLNEAWYWGDNRVKEYLKGYMYENRILNYLLWKYEDSLQNRGYTIGNCSIESEQIEHISPQRPTNGEPISTGYDVDENNEYFDGFIDKELNCLGNLMLISGSHNASIGNKPFSEKLLSYKSNPLLKQQAEIQEFIADKLIKWGALEIAERQDKIVNKFALTKWNFDSVKTD